MELTERQIELIGAYLQNRLEGEELASFLAELEGNTAMAGELKLQRAIQDGIEHKNNEDLRRRLTKIAHEKGKTDQKSRTKSIPLIKLVYAVAAILILGLAAIFLFDGKEDAQSLYTANFKPAQLTITRSTDMQQEMVRISELYNTEEYEEALPLFQSVLEAEPTASNLRLGYGTALMKSNNNIEARNQLTYIIDQNDPLYSDQAKWYLALLELNEGRLDQAKKLLGDLLSDLNSDNYAEAQRLLESIERL